VTPESADPTHVPPSAIDPATLRLGVRRLAAAVSRITTELDDGTRRGMTATAVCSVSIHPPTLLTVDEL